MTIQSGFFNSINGDRRYDANWFSAYFASFIGNGVFPNPSTGLQVVEGNNMNIVVKAGKGWINGYFVVNDSDYTLTLDNADGVLKRIDRVVMRLNYLTRQIEIDVKKGIFASNPVAPTLQRDTDMHELALADVLINNGATAIIQANITDTRLNSELCGIVHGTVDQVDTETLFNQYQSWFNDYTIEARNNFETWFNGLQDILDENIAATLTNKVLELENNKIDKSSIGQADGVAPLNNDSVVSKSFLPNFAELYEVAPGDIGIFSDATGFNLSIGSVYTQSYSKQLGANGGCRIAFNLQGNSSVTVYAKIYVNGEPYSDEFSATGTSLRVSVDVTGLKTGDTVEIWGRRNSGTTSVNNVRFINIGLAAAPVVF